MDRDGDIDYRSYSRSELQEALANIDQRAAPRNFKNLSDELAGRPPPIAINPPIAASASPQLGSSLTTVYAGFWWRLWALTLDALVLLPLTILYSFGCDQYHFFYLFYAVPGFMFHIFYYVYLVRRYGGTPGKLMAGLRIVTPEQLPIGYRQAIFRFAPFALFSVIGLGGLIAAELALTDAQFLSTKVSERMMRLNALAPLWFHAGIVAMGVFGIADFIVMMTNHQRRALHDFIGETVVIKQHPDLAVASSR